MKQQVDNVCNAIVGNKTFIRLIKCVIFSYVLTIILFLILALILCNTDFPENYMDKCVRIVTFTSILLAGFLAAKGSSSKGWLCGVMSGTIYMLLLFILDCILLRDFQFNMKFLYMLVFGLGFGFLGGIVGINLRGKTKRGA